MINITLLAPRMAFDSSVLLPAFSIPGHPEAGICKELFDVAAESEAVEVLIPAPALSEVMRGGSNERPDRVPGVEVVSFDLLAAVELATRFPSSELKKYATPGEPGSSDYYKYDALIVAVAIRHLANVLVTRDKGQAKLAKAVGLLAMTPKEFQGVEVQPKLPGLERVR